MYQAHFGLSKGLFDSGIAQESAVFLGPKQQLAVANCKIAFTTFDSAVVITGPAGVGKTTLAATALRESNTRLALGWLNGSPANPSELLEMLLVEFGFNSTRTGRVERLQMWRQFLNETNATDSRVFVIAECAEDLAPELLRALESLTRADANGCRGANLVLLGQPGLTEHLQAPSLESLRQRIRLRQRLEPLTVDELRDYLAQLVTQAGGTFDKVFAAEAVAAVHQHSGGIPRVVNNLCETALTLAATRREQQLTAQLVTRIAVGLFGLETAPDAPRVAATAPVGPPRVTAPPSNAAAPPPTVATPLPNAAAPSPSVTPPAPSAAAPSPSVTSPAPSAAAPAPTAVAPQPSVSSPAIPAATAARAGDDAQPKPITSSAAAPPPVPASPTAERVTLAPPAPSNATRPAAHPSATKPPPSTETPPRAAPRPLFTTAAVQPRENEYDGSETDIAHEILGETTVADIPEVAMVEFPVLTDAVEAPSRPAARTEPPRAKPAPAVEPAAPPAGDAHAAASAKRAAAPSTAKPSAPTPSPDDEERQTQTMHALATAKSIDDISNSMAETLFGEADLDMLSAALASAGWSENEGEAVVEPAVTPNSEENTGKAKAADPFDLFDLGPDAPLELIDDSSMPPQKPFRKFASSR